MLSLPFVFVLTFHPVSEHQTIDLGISAMIGCERSRVVETGRPSRTHDEKVLLALSLAW